MSDAARAKEVDGVDRSKEAADYLDTCFGVGTIGRIHVARLREAAEQTAALREENARLRGAMLRETEAFHNTGGECGWCGDPWLTHTASCLIGKWRALLADPEGQGHE